MDMPPLPPIPPIPPLPPLPNGVIAPFITGDLDWDFESRAYAEQLTGDEQIQLQALAALWDRDENAALPEVKRLAREHENWAMRAAAVRLLANSESAESLAILDEVLSKDTDRRVRKAAVQALANRSEPQAREILKRLLQK
jgi:HEAT repeat protein